MTYGRLVHHKYYGVKFYRVIDNDYVFMGERVSVPAFVGVRYEAD